MRSNRQPVATHGNGFGVIPPLSRLRDLPPLVTGSRLAMATTSSPHRSRVSAGPFGWFRHVRCERRRLSGGERAHGGSHVRCSESPRAGIADQTDLQWDVAECGKCDRTKTSLAALDGMPVDSSRLTDRLRGRRAIPGRIARLPNPARSR